MKKKVAQILQDLFEDLAAYMANFKSYFTSKVGHILKLSNYMATT